MRDKLYTLLLAVLLVLSLANTIRLQALVKAPQAAPAPPQAAPASPQAAPAPRADPVPPPKEYRGVVVRDAAGNVLCAVFGNGGVYGDLCYLTLGEYFSMYVLPDLID